MRHVFRRHVIFYLKQFNCMNCNCLNISVVNRDWSIFSSTSSCKVVLSLHISGKFLSWKCFILLLFKYLLTIHTSGKWVDCALKKEFICSCFFSQISYTNKRNKSFWFFIVLHKLLTCWSKVQDNLWSNLTQRSFFYRDCL